MACCRSKPFFHHMEITRLLQLRLLQTYRMLKEVGILLLLLLVFVSIAFVSSLALALVQSSFWESFILGNILIASIHFSRPDLGFLQIYTSTIFRLRILLWAEYLLALSPLVIMVGLYLNGGAIAGLLLSSFLIFILPVRRSSFLWKSWNPPLKWVPGPLFELRSLLRRRLVFALIIYLVGYLSFVHIAFFILCVIAGSLLISTAFEWVEPPALIKWEKHFFSKKIMQHTIFIQGLLMPIYLEVLIFHTADYIIAIFGIIMIQLFLIFSIFYKYAFYHPKAVKISQSINHALFFLFLLIPGFQVISILICVWYGVKANKNMSYFWNEKLTRNASDK